MASTITGRLRKPNNQVAASTPFNIYQENLGVGAAIYTKLLFTSQTDASGNLTLNLVPGIYQLIFSTTKDTLRFEVKVDLGNFTLVDLLLK